MRQGTSLHPKLPLPGDFLFFFLRVLTDYFCVFGMKEWVRGAPYPWVSPRRKQDGPTNQVGRPRFGWRPSHPLGGAQRWSGTPPRAPKERYVTAMNLCFQFGSFTLEIGFTGLLFCCSTSVLLSLMYLCMKGNLAQFVYYLEKDILERHIFVCNVCISQKWFIMITTCTKLNIGTHHYMLLIIEFIN